jgi:hypothetical protein
MWLRRTLHEKEIIRTARLFAQRAKADFASACLASANHFHAVLVFHVASPDYLHWRLHRAFSSGIGNGKIAERE